MEYNEEVANLMDKGFKNLKKSKFDKSLEYYFKALSIEPENPVILSNIAQTYNIIGKEDLSKDYHEKIISICENATEERHLLLKGHSQIILERFDEAKASFRKLLKINPERNKDILYLAGFLRQNEDYIHSNELLDLIINENPDENFLYIAKASNYEDLKEYQKAEGEYNRILKNDPENEIAIKLKGELFIETKETEKLEKHIKESYIRNPESIETFLLDFKINFLKEEFDQCEVILNQALNYDAENDELWFKKGEVYLIRGDIDESIKYFKKAFKYNPQSGNMKNKKDFFKMLKYLKKL